MSYKSNQMPVYINRSISVTAFQCSFSQVLGRFITILGDGEIIFPRKLPLLKNSQTDERSHECFPFHCNRQTFIRMNWHFRFQSSIAIRTNCQCQGLAADCKPQRNFKISKMSWKSKPGQNMTISLFKQTFKAPKRILS